MTTRGARRHLVQIAVPGPSVPDGDGGFTESWQPLDPPAWNCAIHPATARDLERVAGGTQISQATHIVTGDWRSDVTTKARLDVNGRYFNVVHVTNRDERGIELELLCAEVVD